MLLFSLAVRENHHVLGANYFVIKIFYGIFVSIMTFASCSVEVFFTKTSTLNKLTL